MHDRNYILDLSLAYQLLPQRDHAFVSHRSRSKSARDNEVQIELEINYFTKIQLTCAS